MSERLTPRSGDLWTADGWRSPEELGFAWDQDDARRARFELLVLPDGRAILVTDEHLSEAQLGQVRDVLAAWKPPEVMVLPECRVRLIESLELELDSRDDSRTG